MADTHKQEEQRDQTSLYYRGGSMLVGGGNDLSLGGIDFGLVKPEPRFVPTPLTPFFKGSEVNRFYTHIPNSVPNSV